jgi:hypothetical protein
MSSPLPSPLPTSRLVLKVVVIASAALVVMAICVAVWVLWLFLRDSRVDLQPDAFVPSSGQTGISLMTDARNVTSEVCGEEFRCESAWGSTEMVLMKFGTQDDAAAAARALGGRAYRSDWLVAHFTGEGIGEEERRWAAEALDGTWQDHVD